LQYTISQYIFPDTAVPGRTLLATKGTSLL
jgi:hypothetical protein